VLAEVVGLVTEAGRSSHDRYWAVFELLQRRDQELAEALDNPRRSTALLQLARIRGQELLTEEEFARLSPATRASVHGLVQLGQA
jgi:hypothetical protein